jgi:type II secretory pathway component GspD/PulD (secretin)
VSDRLDATFASLPERLALPAGSGLIVQTPVYGPAPSLPGIRVSHQRGDTLAILDALKQEGELKVISKPRLRTLNNQPAVVRVGQDLPVFSRQVTQSPGNPPVITETETIQSITVGTVLSIIPQISANGMITLDVTPAVSRLVRTAISATGNTSAPVIDIRQASSIVRVRNGATVVLGGLVQDSSSVTRRKVPVLGDIPWLGKAFTGSYDNKERTELVFVLTPRVIVDGEASGTGYPGSRMSLALPPSVP